MVQIPSLVGLDQRTVVRKFQSTLIRQWPHLSRHRHVISTFPCKRLTIGRLEAIVPIPSTPKATASHGKPDPSLGRCASESLPSVLAEAQFPKVAAVARNSSLSLESASCTILPACV